MMMKLVRLYLMILQMEMKRFKKWIEEETK